MSTTHKFPSLVAVVFVLLVFRVGVRVGQKLVHVVRIVIATLHKITKSVRIVNFGALLFCQKETVVALLRRYYRNMEAML